MKRLILTLTSMAIAGGTAYSQSLKVYTEINPPQQIQGADGKLKGIAIDTVREIQKRIGSMDPIEIVPWARGYQEAQVFPNVVLFSMSRTAERNARFKWVGPVDEIAAYFYVKTGSATDIKNLEDAKKLRAIGITRNDVIELELIRLGFTNLDRGNNNTMNTKKMLAGHVDAIVAGPGEIDSLAKSAGCKVSDLKQTYPLLKVQLFIAFSKETPEATVKAWADALDAMKKDKAFEAIYRRYEPSKPLPGPAKTAF